MKEKDILKRTANHDLRALAVLLTMIERDGTSVLKHKSLLNPPSAAYRIGITGPPGAGKSTLVSGLIEDFRKRNLRVAVAAIDPSSVFTGGAILGDRIRYMKHTLDSGVFVRSLGTRGSLGGLSAAAYLMLRALDLAGFDVVLVETVGVGQTELEVVNVADLVAVVLVPESGDSVQAMKAGLVEIADVFVVNKADRPGAESFKHELESVLHLEGERTRPVFLTVASMNQGLSELSEFLLSQRPSDLRSVHQSAKRLQQEALALLRMDSERKLAARVKKITSPAELAKLF